MNRRLPPWPSQTARSSSEERRASIRSRNQPVGRLLPEPPGRKYMRRILLITVAAVALAVSLNAADWPQYLGPERNGTYRGPAILDTWPANGPRVAWRKTVGQGFAGPAVAGTRVLLFHR